jgi:biotin carboxyl carrier protein
MIYEVTIAGRSCQVEVRRQGNLWHCLMDGRDWIVNVSQPCPEVLSLLIEGRAYEVRRDHTARGMQIWVEGTRFPVEVRDPRSLRARRSAAYAGEGPQKLVASMPGKVVRVLRSAGEPVEPGEGILVVEAMKMQNELKSLKKGIVRQVLAGEGAAVNTGDVLAIVE